MIIHRDYCSSVDSVIKIFDDHIEFFNPGPLPFDLSVEQLLSGNYRSTPRNRAIATLFKDLGLKKNTVQASAEFLLFAKHRAYQLPY